MNEISDEVRNIARLIMDTVWGWGKHPYDINNGECEPFADQVVSDLSASGIKDSNSIWVVFSEEYGSHCCVLYNGLYFDAEEPYGVKDAANLPFFHRKRDQEIISKQDPKVIDVIGPGDSPFARYCIAAKKWGISITPCLEQTHHQLKKMAVRDTLPFLSDENIELLLVEECLELVFDCEQLATKTFKQIHHDYGPCRIYAALYSPYSGVVDENT